MFQVMFLQISACSWKFSEILARSRESFVLISGGTKDFAIFLRKRVYLNFDFLLKTALTASFCARTRIHTRFSVVCRRRLRFFCRFSGRCVKWSFQEFGYFKLFKKEKAGDCLGLLCIGIWGYFDPFPLTRSPCPVSPFPVFCMILLMYYWYIGFIISD